MTAIDDHDYTMISSAEGKITSKVHCIHCIGIIV